MFIQSFCPYSRNIEGVEIPKHRYSELEMQRGKKNIVEVTKEQLEKLQNNRIFKSLLDNKKYRILEILPSYYKAHEELMKEKNDELAIKQKEIDDLKKQLAEKEKEKDKVEKTPAKGKGKK